MAQTQQHLVVMVHGLNGHPNNWNFLHTKLDKKLSNDKRNQFLFFKSSANQKLRSFGGLEPCAERLSTEIETIVKEHPSLSQLSIIAHSMGGLVSRFACGLHFDPAKKTIFNLRPRHFLSIASPHLGCHYGGDSEVPMFTWGKRVPLMAPLINFLTPGVVPIIYRRTGKQLFLMDRQQDCKGMPLLCMLVQDIAEKGYFLSALKHFETRTCFANVEGDALVSWATSSIRPISKLNSSSVNQPISNSILVKSDPIEASFQNVSNPDQHQQHDENIRWDDQTSIRPQTCVAFMMNKLQSLPWCRIDVKQKGMLLPFLAHTHIQVTRPWMDSRGEPAVEYITDHFLKLDETVRDLATSAHG